MSKVKSAIITAFIVAAIVVMTFFATVSLNVPWSNGVDRYNSFLSSISLGRDLTGEAYTLLYPEGVISKENYNYVVTDDENPDKKAEYESTYVKRGSVYVEKDKASDVDFISSIYSDAMSLSNRLAQKHYSEYSVTVVDSYVIRLSVPTNFSYAAYINANPTTRSAALSEISNSLSIMSYSGELTLRNGDTYETSSSVIGTRYDLIDLIESVSNYSMGGTHAIQIRLTRDGFTRINNILTSSNITAETTLYFFAGESNLNLTMTGGAALTDRTLFFSGDATTTSDYVALLSSLVDGGALVNNYNTDEQAQLVSGTAGYGDGAAIYLASALLLVVIAAIAFSVIKYKKLGLVNAISVLVYALAMITAIMILEINVTIIGAITALVGLALLLVTNSYVFEAVRRETEVGRTVQASVKLGYKKTLAFIIDLHLIVLVASIMLALIGVGEVAACGFIMFIATLASYIIYWFTRFMWYVISSPVKDKFKFGGFSREAYDDED